MVCSNGLRARLTPAAAAFFGSGVSPANYFLSDITIPPGLDPGGIVMSGKNNLRDQRLGSGAIHSILNWQRPIVAAFCV